VIFSIPLRTIRDSLRGLLGILAVTMATTTAFAEEPKLRTYALSAAPLEIYDRLAELKMGTAPRLPDDERKLLAQIWERKAQKPAEAISLEEAVLLDAMLFASGIEDAEARRKYRAQVDTLAAKARDDNKKLSQRVAALEAAIADASKRSGGKAAASL
jgi:cell division protein FtsB